MWVKFKKGHPAFAYFVGDVCELNDEVVEAQGLNENGYTVPATKAEVEAAKKAIEEEAAAAEEKPSTETSLAKALELIQEQRAEIEALRAGGKPAAKP